MNWQAETSCGADSGSCRAERRTSAIDNRQRAGGCTDRISPHHNGADCAGLRRIKRGTATRPPRFSSLGARQALPQAAVLPYRRSVHLQRCRARRGSVRWYRFPEAHTHCSRCGVLISNGSCSARAVPKEGVQCCQPSHAMRCRRSCSWCWLSPRSPRRPPAPPRSPTVTTTADELNSNGNCSLREAIRAANTDSAVDTCPSGSGADAILLPYGDYAGG